jgi:hypothetical protein
MKIMRNTLHRIKTEEAGVALVVAMSVLLVTGLLAAAVVTAASNVTTSSLKDTRNKRALAAAQAGVNAAVYRLVNIATAPSSPGTLNKDCITNIQVTWSSTSPHCPGITDSLGNGESYTYYVTAALDPSLDATLTGHAAVRTACGTANAPADQRCITSIGKINGVPLRRIQIRVAGVQLFSVGGVLGFKSVAIASSSSWTGLNFNITSDTASNGAITFGNNVNPPVSPYTCFIGPSGSAPAACPKTPVPTLTAPSVDTLPFAASAAVNSNTTIVANATYTDTVASPRTLVVTGALQLTAGDYNFCNVTVNNGGSIKPTAGRVRIFVDSNARSGSGCLASQGKFNANQDSILDGTAAGSLEINVYGTSVPSPPGTAPPPATCNNDFTYYNGYAKPAGNGANVFIFAPNSNVRVDMNSYMNGAIVGCTVVFNALSGSAQFDSPPASGRPSGNFGPTRGTWRECKAVFVTDPEAGCRG